jgi:hypothetical protein
VNSAYLLLNRSSLPEDAGSLVPRIVRGLLSILLFFATYGLYDLFLEGTGLDKFPLAERFLEAAIIMFVSVWGTVKLGLKFGLTTVHSEAQNVEPKGQLA